MGRIKKSGRRAFGTGGIIRRGSHFRLRLRIDGNRTEKTLCNPDGTPCTTRADAEKAARLVDRSIYELDKQEKYVEKIAEIRQLKVEHLASASDVWNLYTKSANRPDTSSRALEEQHALLERFSRWLREKYSSGLDGVTETAASEYLHEIGEMVSNRTFDGYLTTLRLIYETVFNQLGMHSNPFAKIRRRPLETISRKEFTAEAASAFLKQIRHSGECVEIRVLEGQTEQQTKSASYHAFFSHDELDRLPEALEALGLKSYKGIYYTLNLVDPTLHANAPASFVRHLSGTAANEIVRNY